ncbi:hypothetical protein M8J76_013129 [Diaphorina citri]|nr:hypothetical protein M8J76_013129 [Diaphorina citri]
MVVRCINFNGNVESFTFVQNIGMQCLDSTFVNNHGSFSRFVPLELDLRLVLLQLGQFQGPDFYHLLYEAEKKKLDLVRVLEVRLDAPRNVLKGTNYDPT